MFASLWSFTGQKTGNVGVGVRYREQMEDEKKTWKSTSTMLLLSIVWMTVTMWQPTPRHFPSQKASCLIWICPFAGVLPWDHECVCVQCFLLRWIMFVSWRLMIRYKGMCVVGHKVHVTYFITEVSPNESSQPHLSFIGQGRLRHESFLKCTVIGSCVKSCCFCHTFS